MNTFVSLSKSVKIEESNLYFEGHFPGYKIYPAMAQLDHLRDLISNHINQKIEFTNLQKVKFVRPIRPNCFLEVSVQLHSDHFSWTITSSDYLCSRGSGGFVVLSKSDAPPKVVL